MTATQGSKMCRVSLLIIVQSSKHLEPLLDSIEQQTFPMDDAEVVFLDQQTDWLASTLLIQFTASHSFARVITPSHEVNIPRGRNLLIDEAGGEVLAFTDDDVTLPVDWLQDIDQAFRDGATVLGGRMDSNQTGFIPVFENRRKEIWYRHIDRNDISHLETANLAVDASLMESVRFDPEVNWAADLDLVQRLESQGNEITFDVDLKVYHNHRETLPALLRQHFNYGAGLRGADVRHSVFSRKKKLKMLWYVLFPFLLPLLMVYNPLAAFLSGHTLLINKYSPRMVTRGLKTGDAVDISALVIEPLRYFAFTYGYLYQILKDL